jgi:hypothetical protein
MLRFASVDREALIFLHIPKTAGTTLNRIIEWQYNPVSIFTVDPKGIRATIARFKTFSTNAVAGSKSCVDICFTAFMNSSRKALRISQCSETRWPDFYQRIVLSCADRFTLCTEN